MRRILRTCACAWVLLLGLCVRAYAALPGTTCSTAIPLGDNYSAQITGTKTVWYSAWTFDLPLSVYFIPQNQTDPKPEVEMDFSCTSGVYTDSIICSLFCRNSGSGLQIDMPHKPSLKTGTTDDGQFCYYLAIGKEYRDLLLKTGIDYNVEVFVKVSYKSPGTISIAPDDMFTNCMSAKFMHIGDTVHVASQDADRHVIVPYVQWQQDSIRYIWDGTAPCEVTVAGVCEYNPMNYLDGNILQRETLQAHDTAKVTSKDMSDWVKFADNEAGMFFAKFYTEGTGTMKIEHVPQAPPRGGATLLRYDKVTPVPADSNALYAIPYTWDTATIFTTPTDYVFRMYIGTEPDFYLHDAIDSCQFHKNDAGHWYGYTSEQMQDLWTRTTEQYLYVRFVCNAKTTIKPAIWEMSDCMKASNVHDISWPKTTVSVERSGYGAAYYRFYFREWSGGNMTFKWGTNQSTCPTYIGKNCSFPANASNSNVIANKTIPKTGTRTWTIDALDMTEWAEYVDEDGYLYIRFYPNNPGSMTISSTAPAETDPEPIVYPKGSIWVSCDGEKTAAGQRFVVSVSMDHNLSIYLGEPDNIASRTPIETWSQTSSETHALVLSTGVYTLIGDGETVCLSVE